MLSYIFLRGRCSNCQAAISVRYPIVEAVTGLLSLLVVLHFGATAVGLTALVLVWGLIALTVIDLDEQLLPDQLTLPLLWLGLLVNINGMFSSREEAIALLKSRTQKMPKRGITSASLRASAQAA